MLVASIFFCIASAFVEKIAGLPLIYVSIIIPLVSFLRINKLLSASITLKNIRLESRLMLLGLSLSWLLTLLVSSYVIDSLKYIFLMIFLTFLGLQLSIYIRGSKDRWSRLLLFCRFYSYYAKQIITGFSPLALFFFLG